MILPMPGDHLEPHCKSSHDSSWGWFSSCYLCFSKRIGIPRLSLTRHPNRDLIGKKAQAGYALPSDRPGASVLNPEENARVGGRQSHATSRYEPQVVNACNDAGRQQRQPE